jgi:hypothetical protein
MNTTGSWSNPAARDSYDPLTPVLSDGLAPFVLLFSSVTGGHPSSCVSLQLLYFVAQRPCALVHDGAAAPQRQSPLYRVVVPLTWDKGSAAYSALSNAVFALAFLAFHGFAVLVYHALAPSTTRSVYRGLGGAMARLLFPAVPYAVARLLMVGMVATGLRAVIDGPVDDIPLAAVAALAGFALLGPAAVACAILGFARGAYAVKLGHAGAPRFSLRAIVNPSVIWFPETLERRLGPIVRDWSRAPLAESAAFSAWQMILICLAASRAESSVGCYALNGTFAAVAGVGSLATVALQPFRARWQNVSVVIQSVVLVCAGSIAAASTSTDVPDTFARVACILLLVTSVADGILGCWLQYHGDEWRRVVVAHDTDEQLRSLGHDAKARADGERQDAAAETRRNTTRIPGLDDSADEEEPTVDPGGWLGASLGPNLDVDGIFNYSLRQEVNVLSRNERAEALASRIALGDLHRVDSDDFAVVRPPARLQLPRGDSSKMVRPAYSPVPPRAPNYVQDDIDDLL